MKLYAIAALFMLERPSLSQRPRRQRQTRRSSRPRISASWPSATSTATHTHTHVFARTPASSTRRAPGSARTHTRRWSRRATSHARRGLGVPRTTTHTHYTHTARRKRGTLLGVGEPRSFECAGRDALPSSGSELSAPPRTACAARRGGMWKETTTGARRSSATRRLDARSLISGGLVSRRAGRAGLRRIALLPRRAPRRPLTVGAAARRKRLGSRTSGRRPRTRRRANPRPLNADAAAWLQVAEGPLPAALGASESSPVWSRAYSHPAGAEPSQSRRGEAAKALDAPGLRRMVVGHRRRSRHQRVLRRLVSTHRHGDHCRRSTAA